MIKSPSYFENISINLDLYILRLIKYYWTTTKNCAMIRTKQRHMTHKGAAAEDTAEGSEEEIEQSN